MSTMKKTLALVLALVLIVSCIPATALTVFAEGETETTAKQVSLQNFDGLSAGSSVGSVQNNTSYAQVEATVSADTGVGNSNAVEYKMTSYGGTNSENLTITFTSQTLAAEDIVWFWVDSETNDDRLLHVQFGGSHLGKKYIYTIANVSGTPTITQVDYCGEAREGTGLAMVDSGGNGSTDTTTGYARIRLDAGWSGWIGIPAGNFCGNGSTAPATSDKILFRTFGVKNTNITNQSIYFDELWLTDAKSMPNLTNEQLLFDPDYVAPAPEPDGTFYDVTFNGTGVESDGEATVEEGKTYSATLSAVAGYTLPETVTVTVGGEAAEATYDATTGALSVANVTGDVVITAVAVPIPYRTQLWSLDESDDPFTGTLIVTNNASPNRNPAASTRSDGTGVGGSNAWAYTMTEFNSTGSQKQMTLVTNIAGKDLTDNGFNTSVKTKAANDVLWFWVDADVTQNMRIQPTVNSSTLKGGNIDATTGMNEDLYIYTIDNVDGTPTLRKVYHTKYNSTFEGIGFVNVGSNSTNTTGNHLKFMDGWYGWVGIPMNMLSTEIPAGTAITGLQMFMRMNDSVDGVVAEQKAGDTFYFDEFWLTSDGLMPNLTNDELFYNGDQDYLSLNSRYGSGMIFQQNKPFMIHGKAHNGAEVKVELLDSTNTAVQTKTVTVGEAEEWSVLFEGVAGSYNAYSVKVTAGNLNKTISNVVFGEVWVAGGQSNMDYTINQTAGNVSNDTYAAGIAQAFGSDVDVAELQTRLAAEGSNAEFIRIYLQDSVTADLNAEHTDAAGRWTNGSVWNDVKSSSAIAFYYAEMLQKQLNVPVGIIETPKGGTSMAVWVDKDVLTEAKYPEAYKVISDLGYFTDTNAATHVASYFNSRINPFQGYEVKGVVWYQGENDRFNPQVQQALPPVLLESWSKVFTTDPANVSDTALDFVVFQIAPFIGYASGGVYPDANLMTNTDLNAAMREGFAKVAKTGNVVIVPIYDLSAVVDNHHPLNKLEVAKRLMAALNETYYAATFHDTYTGPAVSAVTYGEGTVTITFDRAVRYIQLTETGNQRINPRGGYTLPAATELWGDKANGFSLYTGKEYVSVETVAIDGNKVTLTVPEGVTSIAGVAYAYGVEVLSANIYSSTGLPALPFYAENPDYVPEPEEPETHQTQLWTLDESNDAFTGTWVSTNSNRNSASVTRSSGTGIGGSNALAYTQTVINTSGSQKQMTWIANLTAANLSGAGFKTTVTTKAANDVLWFWVDSDSSQNMRIQPTIAGGTLKGGNIDATTGMNENLYIYTIDNVDGTPTLRKVYHTQYASEFTGVGYINVSSTNKNETGNHLKFMDGWCGWVGIPMNMLNNEPAAGTAITAMQFFMRMNDTVDGSVAGQQVGDAFYFDEFWLTSDGMMPNLTNEQLFYNGDPVTPDHEVYNVTFNGTNVTSNGAATVAEGESYTATLTAAEGYILPETITVTVGGAAAEHTYNATTGELTIANVTGDVVITAVGEEEPEPEPEFHQTAIWNQESNTSEVNIARPHDSRNDSLTTVVTGNGISGSKALKFEATEADTITTAADATKPYARSITQTLSGLAWATYGGVNATVRATDDIFWMWVDADWSTSQRFTFQLEGKDILIQTTGETYIYTIVDVNGTPTMQKVIYDEPLPGATESIDLVNENPNTQKSGKAQIRLSKDFSGWIGIPLNMLNTVPAVGSTLAKFSLMLNQYACDDPIENQNVGDTVYLDEFWLTSAGKMPNLSDEALLYKGDVEPLAFSGASLTLEEGISVNFKVDGEVIRRGYENPYAVLKIRDLEYTVEGVYNETKDEYAFKLYNIRPDWMGETITAELYATKDSNLVASEAVEYSVAQYCYNMLKKRYSAATDSDSLSTLLVNILSYGAAAQTYAGDTANGLVTDELTETWAGWITTDYTAAAADTSVGTELAEPGVTFQSASLFLRESVRIRLKLAGTVTGPITVKVTDAAGNAITEASLGGCNGYVFLDGLNAQQMRTVLKITVYSGEEAVSNTLTYSIRSYADSFILADSTTALAKLMKAMMIYGDSAYNYVNGDKPMNDEEKVSVLFIGNSLTYYNSMPGAIFAAAAADLGYNIDAVHITEGGQVLSVHADPTSVTGAKIEAALQSGKYDYVVLQEGSSYPASEDHRPEYYDAVRNLAARVRAAGAVPVLYCTLPYKEGNPALTTNGWTSEEMAWRLAAGTAAIGKELDIEVAYVGLATYNVYSQGNIELYNEDLKHPSYAGSFLAGMTILAEIFRVDPTSVSFNGSLDAETAMVLKQAAKDIVFNTPQIPAEYVVSSEGVTAQ